jgi:hypothetical protein
MPFTILAPIVFVLCIVGGFVASLEWVRETVKSFRKSAVVNIWVDANEYAPGAKSQTMYK